jgi:hypothetical protein
MGNKDFHKSLDWNTRFAIGGDFSRDEIGEMLEQIKEYEEKVDMESKYEAAVDGALEDLKELEELVETADVGLDTARDEAVEAYRCNSPALASLVREVVDRTEVVDWDKEMQDSIKRIKARLSDI